MLLALRHLAYIRHASLSSIVVTMHVLARVLPLPPIFLSLCPHSLFLALMIVFVDVVAVPTILGRRAIPMFPCTPGLVTPCLCVLGLVVVVVVVVVVGPGVLSLALVVGLPPVVVAIALFAILVVICLIPFRLAMLEIATLRLVIVTSMLAPHDLAVDVLSLRFPVCLSPILLTVLQVMLVRLLPFWLLRCPVAFPFLMFVDAIVLPISVV